MTLSSFLQSRRWLRWFFHQPVTWTVRRLNQLSVIRTDLSRVDGGQHRRIVVHRTAPNLRVRVRAEHCSMGGTE